LPTHERRQNIFPGGEGGKSQNIAVFCAKQHKNCLFLVKIAEKNAKLPKPGGGGQVPPHPNAHELTEFKLSCL